MTKHPFSRWCGCPDCMFGPDEPDPVDSDDFDPEPPLPPAGAAHPMTTSDLFKSYGRVDIGYLADLEYERRKDMAREAA